MDSIPLPEQLLLKAGAECKQTVFLFSDNQIKDESFMEDISMILNTGDVPNLYASDEKAEILEKMQAVAKQEVSLIMLAIWNFLPSKFWAVYKASKHHVSTFSIFSMLSYEITCINSCKGKMYQGS